LPDSAVNPLDVLQEALTAQLGARLKKIERAFGEITVTVGAADYVDAALILRDHAELKFEQLMDLCGVDYSSYRDEPWEGARFCVVTHLLSLTHNWRLRLKVFCPDDDVPQIATLTEVWSGANWYEREAFDLFGIIFEGHVDLRRILTDYGFIGHPFRKDFPLIGNVEVRYDAEKQRVVYEPVSIEPRTLVPKVIRDDNRYDPALKSTK
jgi:NADH-quinone oxidoreductase subunit C